MTKADALPASVTISSLLSSTQSEDLSAIELEAIQERSTREQRNRLKLYRPYYRQALFHGLGRIWSERLLRAGNQQGKTLAGGMEMAMHLTGIYPEWWLGRRFDYPIDAWAACDTGESTRDNPQRVLIGPIGQWGTGSIPGDHILEVKRGRGVADLIDTVVVLHKPTGQKSRIGFKRYDQGREAWQGPSKHAIWCDEEPPLDVYSEALARLIATKGIIYTTFTPLKGMSEVVEKLLGQPFDVNMTIDDAEHIPAEDRARIIAAFPEHEREARSKGVPILGSGRVFPISEEAIRCQPFDVPAHWVVWGAMDFGWDHPFGAVKFAWDKDADCVYVTHAYRVREQTPIVHAGALKPWGPIRWVWPHDGHQHDKSSGDQLAASYRAQGLKMHTEHATHQAGGYGLEAGIMDMLDRMKTGRFKVFASLGDWFEEFRLYHRKDGQIVKKRDDLLSATRIGLMMKRIGMSPTASLMALPTAMGSYNALDGAPGHAQAPPPIAPYLDWQPDLDRKTQEETGYNPLS